MKQKERPTPKRDIELATQVLRDILKNTVSTSPIKVKAVELMFRRHGVLKEKREEERRKEIWLPLAPSKEDLI